MIDRCFQQEICSPRYSLPCSATSIRFSICLLSPPFLSFFILILSFNRLIDQNFITQLDPNLFSNLTSLLAISLSGNGITTLPPTIFKNLNNLEEMFVVSFIMMRKSFHRLILFHQISARKWHLSFRPKLLRQSRLAPHPRYLAQQHC